jgi:uncharacterized repeat protein (TIGR03803 family)
VISDSLGNLYSTTAAGGAFGNGTVFKLGATGKETVLHSFTGGNGGREPFAGLVRDTAANLYGTSLGGSSGNGTVFKLQPNDVLDVLYSFPNAINGSSPDAGLIRDGAGNLYGATTSGGAFGNGTVFKLNISGKETVLHSFTGGADGGRPFAALIRDAAGNLYGTTSGGGAFGHGTVFKLDTTGRETVLHSFTGGAGGSTPFGGLVRDSAGNLYGTAAFGGDSSCFAPGGAGVGCGIVFKLTP